MSTTYFIAGSVFLVLSIVWYFIERAKKRNSEIEKAKKDIDDAVTARDWDALDDARRRMR